MQSQLLNWNFYDFVFRVQVKQRTSISPTYSTVYEKGIEIQ